MSNRLSALCDSPGLKTFVGFLVVSPQSLPRATVDSSLFLITSSLGSSHLPALSSLSVSIFGCARQRASSCFISAVSVLLILHLQSYKPCACARIVPTFFGAFYGEMFGPSVLARVLQRARADPRKGFTARQGALGCTGMGSLKSLSQQVGGNVGIDLGGGD